MTTAKNRSKLVWLSVVTLFVCCRLLLFLNTKSVVVPDSANYLPSALNRFAFVKWSGAEGRASIIPQLYFAIVKNVELIVIGHLIISVLAWLLLAQVVRNRTKSIIASAIVLVFSLTPAVCAWDQLLITDSLSISFSVFFATALLLPVPKNNFNWVELCVFLSSLATVLTRAQNILFVLPILTIWLLLRFYRQQSFRFSLHSVFMLAFPIFISLWSVVLLSQAHTRNRVGFAVNQVIYYSDNARYLKTAEADGMPNCPPLKMAALELRGVPAQDNWGEGISVFNLIRSNFDNKCPGLIEWTERGALSRIQFLKNPILLLSLVNDDKVAIFGGPNIYSRSNSFLMELNFPSFLRPFNDLTHRSGWWGLILMPTVSIFWNRIQSRSKKSKFSVYNCLIIGALVIVCFTGIIAVLISDGLEVDRHSIPWNFGLKMILLLAPWFVFPRTSNADRAPESLSTAFQN